MTHNDYIAIYKDDTETEISWGPASRFDVAIQAANHINGMLNTDTLNPSTDFRFSMNKLKSAILNARNPVVLTLDEYGIAVELYKAREYLDVMAWTERAMIEEIRANHELMACEDVGEMQDITDANCLGGLCRDDHPLSFYDTQFREWSGLNDLHERVNLFLQCERVSNAYMSFQEFQATARRVPLSEARDIVGDELDYDDTEAAWLYNTEDCPLYILEHTNGRFGLILERSDWITFNREELERRLYLWAIDEALEPTITKEFVFIPVAGSEDMTPKRVALDFFTPENGFDYTENKVVDSLAEGETWKIHDGIAQTSIVIRTQ